jgi:hypothetical protein
MRSAGRALLRAAAVSLCATAVGGVGAAGAAVPNVTITNPSNGSVSNNRMPPFSGLTDQANGEVTLRIYRAPSLAGAPIQEMSTLPLPGGAWWLETAEPLADGTYTAQATQTNPASETGASLPVTFTVDTGAPAVTLNPPPSPSEDATPAFTGTASDTTPVTVQIHTGATTKGTLVSTATATGTRANWASGPASPALAVGQYTAVATQASSLGNPAGRSGPVTFTVTAPPPPVASFKWFPAVPVTGEPVTLVSSSTATSSPIAEFAWALSSDGPFQAGASTLTTSFATPGSHVVRLRVTDARGLSSVAAETINVINPAVSLMQPFPVVRIAGTDTAWGARLKLVKVQQMPAGVRITVRCRGRGCPIKSIRRIAVSNKRGVAPVEFRLLERSLRAGVTLEIFVFKPGEIGKYTRFVIRRGRLPERLDLCLDPSGTKPLACPSV